MERKSEGSSGHRRRQWLGRFGRAGEGVSDGIGSASKLRDEGQLALLAA